MTEQPEEERLLEAKEACDYLTHLWKLEKPYKPTAFKTHRQRHNIKPDIQLGNSTGWKVSTLNKIPKPQRGKPKKKTQNEGEEGRSSSMILSRYNRRGVPLPEKIGA